MKDTSIDGAIRRALAGYTDQTARQCPDENILAAYLEMSLDAAERQCVESHASGCASCRQTLGLALRLSDSEERRAVSSIEIPSSRRVLFRVSLPVSLVAVVVLTLIAGILFYRVLRESARLPAAPETAQLRSPARAEGISAAKTSDADLLKQKGESEEKHIPAQVKEARKPAPEPSRQVGLTAQTAKDAEVAQTNAAIGLDRTRLEQQLSNVSAPTADKIPPSAAPASATQAGAQVLQAKAGDAALDGKTIASTANEYRLTGEAFSTGAGIGKAKLTANRPEAEPRLRRIDSLSPEVGPLEALMNLTRLVSTESDNLIGKKLGSRTFYFNSGYWIDSQCTKHVSADHMDVESGSADYEEMIRSIPELEKLRPAVVYWNGKNLILR